MTPSRDGDDAYADISPDGTRLAFTRTASGVDRINVMPLAGGDAVPLTSGPSTVAAWSPDGAWIAFARDRSCDGGIFLIRADGSGERRLTPTGGWPVWRPDGTSVAYEATAAEGQQEIRAVSLDGVALPVPESIRYHGSNFPFAYSPDGALLVTTDMTLVASEIWILEP